MYVLFKIQVLRIGVDFDPYNEKRHSTYTCIHIKRQFCIQTYVIILALAN